MNHFRIRPFLKEGDIFSRSVSTFFCSGRGFFSRYFYENIIPCANKSNRNLNAVHGVIRLLYFSPFCRCDNRTAYTPRYEHITSKALTEDKGCYVGTVTLVIEFQSVYDRN